MLAHVFGLFALIWTQVSPCTAAPAHPSWNSSTFDPTTYNFQDELFILVDGELVLLDYSDPTHILPWPAYEGLPMETVWNEQGNVEHRVLWDQLTHEQFQEHFMQSPTWDGIEVTVDIIEDVRQKMFNSSYQAPSQPSAVKCRDPHDKRCSAVDEEGYCAVEDGGVTWHYASHITGYNPMSLGYVRLMTQQLCGTVSGQYGESITHTSSFTVSGTAKDLPYVQSLVKRFFPSITGFAKELGFTLGGGEADSTTISHTYGVTVNYPYAAFLTEQPHIIVTLGTTHATALSVADNSVPCSMYDYDLDFQMHGIYAPQYAYAAIWGSCYTTATCGLFQPKMGPGPACPGNAIPYYQYSPSEKISSSTV